MPTIGERASAKYKGRCARSGDAIKPGDQIVYTLIGWERVDSVRGLPPIPADAIVISEGSGYGGANRAVGSVFRDRRGNHGILYVLASTLKWFEEDGLSFGVGEDEGYIFYHYCRPATPEESTPVIEAEARAGASRKHSADYGRLFARELGVYIVSTDGKKVPLGDGTWIKWRKGFDIYGGGEEICLDPDGLHVWRCWNNGMDGDDWSRNNIGTGGAGAIGFRYELTPERLAFVRSLPGGESISLTKDERRAALLSRLHVIAMEHADPELAGLFREALPFDARSTRASIWVQFGEGGRRVGLVGITISALTSDTATAFLCVPHDLLRGKIEMSEMSDAGLDYSDNVSRVVLHYAATPDQIAAIRSRMPSWVGTDAPGRYCMRGHPAHIADNAADALRCASIWKVPVGGVTWNPDDPNARYRPMVTADPDVFIIFTDKNVVFWSDGAVSRLASLSLYLYSRQRDLLAHPSEKPDPWLEDGFPPVPPLADSGMSISAAASKLLNHALRSSYWRDNSLWKSLLSIESVEQIELKKTGTGGTGNGSSVTLRALKVTHKPASAAALEYSPLPSGDYAQSSAPSVPRTAYWTVESEYWSMGEDGDYESSTELFDDLPSAEAVFRKHAKRS